MEIRNRPDKDLRSTAYQFRFKSLVTASTDRQVDLQTTQYGYDALSRLNNATIYPGQNIAATPTRSYTYGYDVAGNRTQQIVNVGGTPTTTNYTYDVANRLQTSQVTGSSLVNYAYDNAGNLTNDGTNAYTWDRANRLLSMGGSSYQYDGTGKRVQQTLGAQVTQYLLDIQPGLEKVLQATTGANTIGYVHGPMGIHEQQNLGGAWIYPVQDGLGSVREVVDNSLAPLESRLYSPYGKLEVKVTAPYPQSLFPRKRRKRGAILKSLAPLAWARDFRMRAAA